METWYCYICGQKRPDDKISVHSKPLVVKGQVIGQQNVRYCNDKPDCIAKAPGKTFIKEEKERESHEST